MYRNLGQQSGPTIYFLLKSEAFFHCFFTAERQSILILCQLLQTWCGHVSKHTMYTTKEKVNQPPRICDHFLNNVLRMRRYISKDGQKKTKKYNFSFSAGFQGLARMHFELHNAPEMPQRAVNAISESLKLIFVLVYLNDNVVFFRTLTQYRHQ